MSQGADELQRVFKTLSDPTRVRILRLLEAEELMVQELMEVLGMAQSRVSRAIPIKCSRYPAWSDNTFPVRSV